MSDMFVANKVIDQNTPTEPVGVTDTRSLRARKWIRLDSIQIKNFKAIQDVTIPLGDVTILVGPNGCGKSSALQAIHWAARAASYIAPKNKSEMISFDRMDYIPSSEPLKTAHKTELKPSAHTNPTKVIFKHSSETDSDSAEATVSIFAARNKGGITAHLTGGSAVTPYKQRVSFITAYIPGLAGLSERETILAQPLLRRQAASGDAGGVLRNILYNIRSRKIGEEDESQGQKRLTQLNQLVSQVHPGFTFGVTFDEREDHHISALYFDSNVDLRSLETLATGILQVIQIFAYLILFGPKVMLIDEPDAHLHPDKQERLIETLENAAKEFETQIILTTHSPHITRAASNQAKLIWMNKGKVETDDSDAIRRLLGWGGLNKNALFFVEDKDDFPLRKILSQWPQLTQRVAVCRCFGLENLPKDKLLEGLLIDGEIKIKAIVHRDGDFMTKAEIPKWIDLYKTEGVFPWVTPGSDIEAYFCSADYLSTLYNVEPHVAEVWRIEAANNVGKAHATFLEKRKKIVNVIWPNGGSPDAETLWKDGGEKSPANVKGKSLLAQLKVVVKKNGYDDKKLNSYEVPKDFEMAKDLKAILELATS